MVPTLRYVQLLALMIEARSLCTHIYRYHFPLASKPVRTPAQPLMHVQGGGGANPNYCSICQVVCTSPRDLQSHLQGQRHARRQAASVAAPLISSNGGCFCTLCNTHVMSSSMGPAVAMNDHTRSSWHLERLKTRVLEDRRLHGPLFSDKAGLSISSLGPVTRLQGTSETLLLTISNASGSLRVLRGVWQLSHVPQVSHSYAPAGDNRLVSPTQSYHPQCLLTGIGGEPHALATA